MTPRRIQLCDVMLVNNARHRLEAAGFWRVTSPDGSQYRFCCVPCLVTFCCEPGGAWGWAPRRMQEYSATGTAG